MAASGVSGKDGTMTGITGELIHWHLDKTCFVGAYGSNESGNGTSKVAGRPDAKGTATFKTAPNCAEGDDGSAVLSNGEKTYSFDYVVSGVAPDCDVNTGDVNTYEVSFEVDGEITEGTSS